MDKRDVERLFQEVGPRVWRAVYGYVGGRTDMADEAVAEAFARAIHHASRIRDPGAWVYRTALRFAAGELKRERSNPGGIGNPTSDLVHLEIRRDLLEALRRLPPKQRAALVLHYVDDRPVEEVARLMGIAGATARVHLHRARRRMRTLLREELDG